MPTAYITIEDLGAEIPTKFLTQALDDNGDGAADAGAWDAIATAASDDVDAFLAGRFTTPFGQGNAPIPPLVKRATRIFALEKLYLKRGITNNPWTKQADAMRDKLTAVGNGEQPLALPIQRGRPSATAISEKAKTTSGSGKLSI